MSTPNIIAICERLSDDVDYQAFCEYLIESHKDETFDLMTESEPGASKISAEYFAKAKIYKNLGSWPSLILERLKERKPTKKTDEVYG